MCRLWQIRVLPYHKPQIRIYVVQCVRKQEANKMQHEQLEQICELITDCQVLQRFTASHDKAIKYERKLQHLARKHAGGYDVAQRIKVLQNGIESLYERVENSYRRVEL